MGKSPFLMGKTQSLMGKSPFFKGKSTINGPCSIAIFRGGAHQRRKWSRKDLWMAMGASAGAMSLYNLDGVKPVKPMV